MRVKKVSIILACLVVLTIATVAFIVFNKSQKPVIPTVTSAPTPTPTPFSQEDIDKWNEIYKNPFARHIRKALNGYLNGTNEGIADPDLVIPISDDKEGRSGLNAFSKDYYRSKFIVLSIVNGVYGGKEITIVFQDKPDMAFWVWVYKPVDEDYNLKGFAENTKFTKKVMEDFVKYNKAALEDKENA